MTGDAPRMVPEARLVDLIHDLRTPLTVARGFVDLLGKRPDLPDEQRAEFLAQVAAATKEMVEILDAERASRGLD